ncbi:DUF1761 domain-containing protein [Pseudidiomarina sp.]|uniref:DUF1761 domain-containing protein n=1 Tax=Pseudidiomarina sp. TaxID=2081707 RepID=UPI00299D1CC5|nr:DUF1761 domain-containing protein [Pseudidiomarina sp.]MDX1705938.1 DUF1761 domain-containing protein [Pseudidiomarina sp.]
MHSTDINLWAVLVAALLNFLIGGLWYSPVLFAKSWQAAAGISDEQLQAFKPLKGFGLTFIFSWIISLNLAFFLASPGTNWQWGLTAGVLAGLGWATMIFAVIALFEQRSWRYILIHGGYITIYFAAAGALLGGWG